MKTEIETLIINSPIATKTLNKASLLNEVNRYLNAHELELMKIKSHQSLFFDYFSQILSTHIDNWIDAINNNSIIRSNLNTQYGYFSFAHFLAQQHAPHHWSDEVTIMQTGFITLANKNISLNQVSINHLYDFLLSELCDLDALKYQLRHLLITDNINYLYRNTPPCINRYAVDDSKNINKRINEDILTLFNVYVKTIAITTQSIINNEFRI